MWAKGSKELAGTERLVFLKLKTGRILSPRLLYLSVAAVAEPRSMGDFPSQTVHSQRRVDLDITQTLSKQAAVGLNIYACQQLLELLDNVLQLVYLDFLIRRRKGICASCPILFQILTEKSQQSTF